MDQIILIMELNDAKRESSNAHKGVKRHPLSPMMLPVGSLDPFKGVILDAGDISLKVSYDCNLVFSFRINSSESRDRLLVIVTSLPFWATSQPWPTICPRRSRGCYVSNLRTSIHECHHVTQHNISLHWVIAAIAMLFTHSTRCSPEHFYLQTKQTSGYSKWIHDRKWVICNIEMMITISW